jgi:hypothetical protein
MLVRIGVFAQRKDKKPIRPSRQIRFIPILGKQSAFKPHS